MMTEIEIKPNQYYIITNDADNLHFSNLVNRGLFGGDSRGDLVYPYVAWFNKIGSWKFQDAGKNMHFFNGEYREHFIKGVTLSGEKYIDEYPEMFV